MMRMGWYPLLNQLSRNVLTFLFVHRFDWIKGISFLFTLKSLCFRFSANHVWLTLWNKQGDCPCRSSLSQCDKHSLGGTSLGGTSRLRTLKEWGRFGSPLLEAGPEWWSVGKFPPFTDSWCLSPWSLCDKHSLKGTWKSSGLGRLGNQWLRTETEETDSYIFGHIVILFHNQRVLYMENLDGDTCLW